MKYDIAVIIGRFQPIHKGHIPAFRKAAEIAEHTACVIGSINKPSTPTNPFSYDERKMLVTNALANENIDTFNVSIFGVEDTFYREQEWYSNVKELIAPLANRIREDKIEHSTDILNKLAWNINHSIGKATSWDTHLELHGNQGAVSKDILEFERVMNESETIKIAVVGFDKDESTYYLHNFANWDFVPVEHGQSGNPLSSTKVRELWLGGDFSYAESVLHPYTRQFMNEYPEYYDLVEDFIYIVKYDNDTQVGPFPVQFLTTDAVVVHGDEILLIKRGVAPGRGLWALPGGFKNNNETFFDSCMRELHEETRIAVPEKVLRGSVKDEKMFDFPKRSSRGTTVTMAYLIVLDATQPRPRVKGGDDAVMAHWFSLAEVRKMRDQLFEDHPDIIDYMTARI